ncbi:MAG: aspartyl protease family protein [Terracidiphilus sp.]
MQCPVLHHGPPTDADKALLAADYAKAETLYRAALATNPSDVAPTVGLVHALLRDQKVQEAADTAQAALASAPGSAALITLRGEVEFRQGEPWIAAQSANESFKLDPCNPRTQLLFADLFRLSSFYASARAHILTAHLLDPDDPEIHGEWMMTLPLNQRISEIESYLEEPRGDDAEEVRHLKDYLEHIQKLSTEPRKPCKLISQIKATQMPFAYLMRDATHVDGFGLDVKLNNRSARLEIDTGAGGLLVTSAIAKHAGLQAFSHHQIGGVGDEADRNGFTAYVDSIRIGDLEFQNCAVQVIDGRYMPGDIDGLIGMDVFSQFLVTLDYPMRKLSLSPLPPRPGEDPGSAGKLKTESDDEENDGQAMEKSAQPGTAVAPANAAAENPPTHGPYDRYVAPQMMDYTKVYRVGQDLILPAALNASKIKLFILDTGSWTTTVSPQAAREVTKVYGDSSFRVEGINGEVSKTYLANKIVFRFANLSQEVNDVLAFDTSKLSKADGMEISGLLGATTLFQLTIHIDYRDGLVRFEYDPKHGNHF